jgi:hypothetical protein
MADRDDAVLRHYVSRAKQPKVLAAGPCTKRGEVPNTPVQVNIMFDQGFGSVSDQIDDVRFRYSGTASPVSHYESMCGRRVHQSCMHDGFSNK